MHSEMLGFINADEENGRYNLAFRHGYHISDKFKIIHM
jgi:hypothetical protein